MSLTQVQRRVSRLENTIADLSSSSREHHGDSDLPTLIHQLVGMAQDAALIEKRATARGDDVIALAGIREVCRIADLIARLGGEPDERAPTNTLTVNIDPETVKRIAEIYVTRHKKVIQEPT